ncbi:HAD-IA family hydrolase [Microbulbifer salipaludis]|uniref:HAD-IA family hydrolase n=1 Tax=Microbulbifer salipaludis TaxID=187980 RepID=A0ABS3E861_9GAMM|nr:HAD-IA family hydrolase [Microbulbifer salipaludis]MBN8431475.1 HAD-IA family hydrolase [Microbulbifer salipaludis]
MLVILDWDGTLCNSQARIISCMQRAADRVGLPVLEPAAIGNYIGLGLPEVIGALFPEAHSEQRARLGTYYSEEWLAARNEPLPLFDGVLETLDQLLGAGHQLAVATGKSRRGLDREFEDHGLGHLFPVSRCADETASKPNPVMLREILAETGVDVTDAVMVGDTEYDLKMASAISMPSVGVSYGVHSRERLDRCGPHRIIDHFTELLQWPPLVP